MDTTSSKPNIKHSDRERIVGGFTVVRNKVRYRPQDVSEVLPSWMSSSVRCSEDLRDGTSLKNFKVINEKLAENLRKTGIKRFFPIQSKVIPNIIEFYEGKCGYYGQPRDICISAPTGSGKTLAYTIPLLQFLSTCEVKVIRAVIVLPVRDLAKQVYDTFRRLSEGLNVRTVLLTGDSNFSAEQNEILMRNSEGILLPDVVICTPGRLVDHIYNTHNFCLEHVRFLVIDEADRVIVEEKQDWFNIFESAVYSAMNASGGKAKLKRSFPLPTIESQCAQTPFTLHKILLSATLTHDPEPLKRFRLNFPRLFLMSGKPPTVTNKEPEVESANKPEEINADATVVEPKPQKNHESNGANVGSASGGVGVFSTPSGLSEYIVELAQRQKPLFLAYLVKKLGHERILCFTSSRENTKRLAVLMSGFDGIKAVWLNAGMPLQKRTRLLSAFANGDYQLLICTDAVARGIDIENVSCVVSYEAPQAIKTYVHRIGRTARAGKSGVAYTLLNHNQIRYFKSELKSVGKYAKNMPVHSSKLRPFESVYKKALEQLEERFKAKPKDAFGVAKESKPSPNKRPRASDIVEKPQPMET